MNLPGEPLAESAPMAWRLAPTLCPIDPATGETCAWYHGLWQYLRLMDIVEGLRHQAAFFAQAFASVRAEAGRSRVLVSGAADYGMLAAVLHLFRARGVEADVTVIDLCETPLVLNRWYAERAGVAITTRVADVLAFDPPARFDAIVTHAFLGRFSPEARRTLFRQWHRLLRAGGALITVSPLRPGPGTTLVRFAPDQVQAFRARVLATAEAIGDRLDGPPGQLAEAAERYASRHAVHPVRSAADVEVLLRDAGFTVFHLASVPPTAGAQAGVQGPTVSGGAAYLRIVGLRGER
ncbi:MAG TPA: class I SAM-dependent methyltransferase [Methylomirabilota bacterium]|nr:class I SAM-dependent methyltransferase [Methylomirabilota bacterium]